MIARAPDRPQDHRFAVQILNDYVNAPVVEEIAESSAAAGLRNLDRRPCQ